MGLCNINFISNIAQCVRGLCRQSPKPHGNYQNKRTAIVARSFIRVTIYKFPTTVFTSIPFSPNLDSIEPRLIYRSVLVMIVFISFDHNEY